MLLVTLAVLVALELAYVAGGALVLNALVPRLVARRGTARLDARAWTVVPGLVHVRDLRLDVEDDETLWTLTAQRARLRVGLLPLLRRTLTLAPARVEGLAFRLRVKDRTTRTPVAEARRPPVVDLPAGDAYFAARRASRWTYRIGPFRAAAVEEIWIEDVRLLGSATLHGGPFVRAPGHASLATLRLTGIDGALEVGGVRAAELQDAEISASLAPFDPASVEGAQVLDHLSADATLQARVNGLAFLGFYLRRVPWIGFEDGPGDLSASILVREGRFAPGTSVRFRSEEAGARILDWIARGPGELTLGVDGGDGGTEASLRLMLGAFTLARPGQEPDLRGQGLSLEAHARGLAIAAPFTDPGFTLEVPRAEMPNLAALNDLLGPGAGVEFEGGRAHFRTRLTVPAGGRASGSARFEGTGVALRFGNVHAMADLDLRAKLSGGNLEERRLELDGSELSVRNLAIARAGRSTGRQSGWWADALIPAGTVYLTRPAGLQARVDLHLRDSGPVLAFFTPRKGLPGWVEKLVVVENVAAIAVVDLQGGTVRIDPLAVQGGPVLLEARLELAGRAASGDLYARAGPVALGLELTRGKLKLRRIGGDAAEWFDERGTGAATGR